MKKLQITIENEVHAALLKKQLERKLANHNRTTLVEVASDILAECLLKEKAAQK